MYYEKLQVAPRTASYKPRVYYARDEDWNPLIVKGPLPIKEVQAMVETERIKQILGVPRTNVRREGNMLIADALYDYDFGDSHTCTSGIDKGQQISNIKLKMWKHFGYDVTTERSFLKALALRLVLGTDDTVPCNFVVVGQTVYSVDDPAWMREPSKIWKVKSHSEHYDTMLDTHWEWVRAFLLDWTEAELPPFCVLMCHKYLDRNNWVF